MGVRGSRRGFAVSIAVAPRPYNGQRHPGRLRVGRMMGWVSGGARQPKTALQPTTLLGCQVRLAFRGISKTQGALQSFYLYHSSARLRAFGISCVGGGIGRGRLIVGNSVGSRATRGPGRFRVMWLDAGWRSGRCRGALFPSAVVGCVAALRCGPACTPSAVPVALPALVRYPCEARGCGLGKHPLRFAGWSRCNVLGGARPVCSRGGRLGQWFSGAHGSKHIVTTAAAVSIMLGERRASRRWR